MVLPMSQKTSITDASNLRSKPNMARSKYHTKELVRRRFLTVQEKRVINIGWSITRVEVMLNSWAINICERHIHHAASRLKGRPMSKQADNYCAAKTLHALRLVNVLTAGHKCDGIGVLILPVTLLACLAWDILHRQHPLVKSPVESPMYTKLIKCEPFLAMALPGPNSPPGEDIT